LIIVNLFGTIIYYIEHRAYNRQHS